MFVRVWFMKEEWFSLFTFLKAGLSKQFCSDKLLKISKIHSNNKVLLETIRGGSRINFRVLQFFTKKIENRKDITMQKNYRLSKKQEGMVLITVGGADLKVKVDSSKKHPPCEG